MSEDSRSIDAMLDDLSEKESFKGLTADEDIFDIAEIKALCYEQRCVIRT